MKRPNQPRSVTPLKKVETEEEKLKRFEEFTIEKSVQIGFENMQFVGDRNPPEYTELEFLNESSRQFFLDLKPIFSQKFAKRLIDKDFILKIKDYLVENKSLYKYTTFGKKIWLNNDVYALLSTNYINLLRRFRIDPELVIKRGNLQGSDLNWLPYQACKMVMDNLYGSNNWRVFNNLDVIQGAVRGEVIVWLAEGRYESTTVYQSKIYGSNITAGNASNAKQAALTQATRACLSRLFNVFSSINKETELTKMGDLDKAYIEFKDLFIKQNNYLPGSENLAIELPKKELKEKKIDVIDQGKKEVPLQKTDINKTSNPGFVIEDDI